MKKLICLSLISLVCGFLSVHASIQADDTKPFVGSKYPFYYIFFRGIRKYMG